MPSVFLTDFVNLSSLQVFGALTSCSLHVSELFYGTGESLLYKFNPSFKVFHWTGENLYFIKGNPESLSIGAGEYVDQFLLLYENVFPFLFHQRV